MDLLAAAASGASVTTSLHVGAAVNPSSTRQPASAASALSPITSIPDAEPKHALPVGRKLRYAAADKLQLSGEEMRDIGRRLRTEPRGPRPVLRVWRWVCMADVSLAVRSTSAVAWLVRAACLWPGVGCLRDHVFTTGDLLVASGLPPPLYIPKISLLVSLYILRQWAVLKLYTSVLNVLLCPSTPARYGIDDLRLYQAIDLADLEGVVVVVDSTADADVVLTTYSKRTRKNVNLATARRAAAGAGVPLLVLPAMSAQRLVEAVGPLLGLPTVQDSPETGANVRQQQEQRQPQQQWGPNQQPRLLRWDEIEGDGSEELLQLMWGGDAASSSRDVGALDPAATGEAVAGACCPSPRWLAWCAAQEASPGCADALWAAVRDADVEEPRGEAVPANPTARAGERHRLLKPLRPGSRIKRRKLRRDLALRQVDW